MNIQKGARATIQVLPGENPLDVLDKCGGFYECPKDQNGKRLGPLVGYAGRYQSNEGGEKQYVGDVYANFAKAERYPHVIHSWACDMEVVPGFSNVVQNADVFCGMPMGGLSFAKMLALIYDRRYVFPEKKVTSLATGTSREESVLQFARHEVSPGDTVVIVEDVLNNFSTTAKAVAMIEQYQAKVVAIVGILNRSLDVNDTWKGLPVVSLVRKPIQEWKQDDPAVRDDIAIGNVVLKPKDQWFVLVNAMATHPTEA